MRQSLAEQSRAEQSRAEQSSLTAAVLAFAKAGELRGNLIGNIMRPFHFLREVVFVFE